MSWAQGPATEPSPAYSPTPPKETVIFPLSQVHRGLRGVAYTVFEGVNPEPMEVEILGLMKNARGPGEDMILARLHGTKPEYTGVVAGMSGSPVYIDGKLMGALSFRIGQFSKEPIAGITPIEEMLEVKDGEATSAGTKPVASTSGQEITPIETPLVFGGFSQETIDRFGDRFRALGLTPVAGLGGSDSTLKQPEPLIPGSAVSAILVRGDLSMAGTCTVTYVDATHLLACGHPITQFGQVSMPMTKATVLATLPSPLNAFKIITTTETVGSFTEDRNSAILGRFGQDARMIPVTIDVAHSIAKETMRVHSPPAREIRLEVLDNKDLTPSAMLVSVFQSLQQTNRASAEISYRLSGELMVEGQPTVKLEGIMAPNELNPAAINTALYINERFGRIYGNSAEQPVIKALHLNFEAMDEVRTATLEQVRLNRVEVRPGEHLVLEASVHPFRAPAKTLRIPITIPTDTAPGDLRLVVSDAATADHLTLPTGGAQGRSVALRDTIDQLNRSHANDGLYVSLLVHNAQTILEGGTMGQVPLSMANVLESQKTEQRIQLTGESATALGSVKTGYAVTGSQVLTIRVR